MKTEVSEQISVKVRMLVLIQILHATHNVFHAYRQTEVHIDIVDALRVNG
jgi:hypothetical protein